MRFLWATQLSQKWSCTLGQEVSTAIIFCCLWEIGFCYCKPATKLLLKHKQKLKQLQCIKMYKDWMSKQWLKVIFSDESKFSIKFGDRGALVWRTKNEHYNLAYLKRSVKFLTSVMVWGYISTRGMGNIVFLKSTVTYIPYYIYGSVRKSCFIHRGSVWWWGHDFSEISDSCTLLKKGQDMAIGAEHSST